MAPCEEDSLLLVVSDGVHDNLDPEVRPVGGAAFDWRKPRNEVTDSFLLCAPGVVCDVQHLGLSPSDVGVDQDKWDSNFEALEKAKHLFRSSCLMQKIRGTKDEVRRPDINFLFYSVIQYL
jgi:hypothetical protein